MDVVNARIFGHFTRDRIHRHDILGIIVPDGREIAELAVDSFLRSKEICDLHIYCLLSAGCYEIDFSDAEDADGNLVPANPEVVVHHVFHHLLNRTAKVESAEIVPKSMVGKIIFFEQFKQLLSMKVIARHVMNEQCVGKEADV